MTHIEDAKGDKRKAVIMFLPSFSLLWNKEERVDALLKLISDIQRYDNEAEYQYRKDSHFDNHC
jgi:hypothetical protein